MFDVRTLSHTTYNIAVVKFLPNTSYHDSSNSCCGMLDQILSLT